MAIYLDNHATTRVDPRVVEAMLPWLTDSYGNANSVGHSFGDEAREAVERSREVIAASIGAAPKEIVFTSGATESNNLAIRGVAERQKGSGGHFVSVVTEHHAVLGPLDRLAKNGYAVDRIGVEPHGSPNAGLLQYDSFAHALTDQICMASVMLANNEMGVIQPIAQIAPLCHERGALLHCDATQAVGKIPVKVDPLGVDLMSFSAHKLHGPKGVGALYVRGRDPIVRLHPQIVGGGQERGRRSGTLNVPGIVGFARAVELADQLRAEESIRLVMLRNGLFSQLKKSIKGIELLGPGLEETDADGEPLRLPNNLNVLLDHVDGETVMLRTPSVAMSSGAACSSADPEPSHVLQALGLDADAARCSLRFGLSRFTTEEEVTQAAKLVAEGVHSLRGLAG